MATSCLKLFVNQFLYSKNSSKINIFRSFHEAYVDKIFSLECSNIRWWFWKILFFLIIRQERENWLEMISSLIHSPQAPIQWHLQKLHFQKDWMILKISLILRIAFYILIQQCFLVPFPIRFHFLLHSQNELS